MKIQIYRNRIIWLTGIFITSLLVFYSCNPKDKDFFNSFGSGDTESTADLEVTITDTPDGPVNVGEEFDVEVTLKNNGPDTAEEPELTLETGVMNGQITQGPESLNCEGVPSNMIICQLANMLSGSEIQFKFALIALAESLDELDLTVKVTHGSSDPNQVNNSDETTIIVEDQPNVLPSGHYLGGLTGIENAILLALSAVSKDPQKNFFSNQANNASFGNLTGNFITAFAYENGYKIMDLVTGEVLKEETGLGGLGPYFGVAGATQDPSGSNSPVLIALGGLNGFVLDRLDQTGPMQFNGTTFDVFPAGGDPVTNVMTHVLPGAGVGFFVFDDAQNQYVPAEIGFPKELFGDVQLISAYMHDDVLSDDPVPQPRGNFLALSQETESGVFLAKWDGSNPVRAIDNIGFDARRLRCIEDGTDSDSLICAVSIFGHNRLGIMTWDGKNEPVLTDFAELDAGPVGIDLRNLPNGNIAVVSTGFDNNTINETVLMPNGRVQSNSSRQVLDGCESPGHAIYIEDSEGFKILATCYNSGSYMIFESEL